MTPTSPDKLLEKREKALKKLKRENKEALSFFHRTIDTFVENPLNEPAKIVLDDAIRYDWKVVIDKAYNTLLVKEAIRTILKQEYMSNGWDYFEFSAGKSPHYIELGYKRPKPDEQPMSSANEKKDE